MAARLPQPLGFPPDAAQLPMNTFQALSAGLSQPLLDKAWSDLSANIYDIKTKYAARGFPLPPGAMYAEISDRYKEDMPARAEIIFDACCQAYSACAPKPDASEFSKQIADAIKTEHTRVIATGEAEFIQLNAFSKNPNLEIVLINYKSSITSEFSRLLTYYSSKAVVFVSQHENKAFEGETDTDTPKHWYQRPIGNIGLTILGGVFLALAIYLIKQYVGIPL